MRRSFVKLYGLCVYYKGWPRWSTYFHLNIPQKSSNCNVLHNLLNFLGFSKASWKSKEYGSNRMAFAQHYIFTYTGWVQKKVWLAALVQLSCMVFFQYFWKFFLVLQWPKEIRETFFLLKSKVQKSKNVYIYYFYQIFKFYK